MGIDYIVTTECGDIIVEESTINLRDNIVDELIAARKHLGYTQQDIADKIGLPRANISRIERKVHMPSLEILVRYAEGLEMMLDVSLKPRNENITD